MSRLWKPTRRKLIVGGASLLAMPSIIRAQVPVTGAGLAKAGNAGVYEAQGVTFSSTAWASSATAIQTSAQKSGICSFWIKNPNAAGAFRYVCASLNASSDGAIKAFLSTPSGAFVWQGYNASVANKLSMSTTTSFLSMSSYKNVIVSWDLTTATQRAQMYVGGVNDSPTVTTLLDDFLPTNVGPFNIAGGPSGSLPLGGSLADFQLWIGPTADLTTLANVRLFIDAGGNPVDPAVAAASALGTQRALFKGTAVGDAWFTNAGSGPSVTRQTGSLTNDVLIP
jgi:hypothetical protein